MAKVKETRTLQGGFGGYGTKQTRVRELAKGEAPKEGAFSVPQETEVHDWKEEGTE
ncbi:MAG: hypothetical protein H0W99_12565 [Acidobacteria bacterium]|nr:hypothetical protein [Acidobacteriota bacterium]